MADPAIDKNFDLQREAVMVNKWAQRIMYTLQTANLSGVDTQDVHRVLRIAKSHLVHACGVLDFEINKE